MTAHEARDGINRDVRVVVLESNWDGAMLVQIDTGERTGQVRVNLNDGAIWDGDAERHDPAAIATRIADTIAGVYMGPDGKAVLSHDGLRHIITAAIEEFYSTVTGDRRFQARRVVVPTGLGAVVADSKEDGGEAWIRISIHDHGWLHPDGKSVVDDEAIRQVLLRGGRIVSEGTPWKAPSTEEKGVTL